MSYDFDTQTAACDHVQTFERYVIDPFDFRTLHLASSPALNMRAPINGQALVLLYISGQKVSPNHPVFGYNIVRDENREELPGTVFYKVQFKQATRLITPLIEVTYLTQKGFCLKCRGTGLVNDLKEANSGSVLHVVGSRKLVQRVLKFILTSRCSFYPNFTCPIKDYIGKKFGISITENDISNSVINSLQSLKKVQSAQRTVQALDPLEMLKDVTSVSAVLDPSDPTTVRVAATVSSYGTNATQPIAFKLTTVS